MSTNCFKWTSKATHFVLYYRNNSTYKRPSNTLTVIGYCYSYRTDENCLIEGCGVLWEQSICFISLYVFSPLVFNLWSILSVVKIDMHKTNSSPSLMFKGFLKRGFMIHVKIFFLQFWEFHIYVFNKISYVLSFYGCGDIYWSVKELLIVISSIESDSPMTQVSTGNTFSAMCWPMIIYSI